jgi:hypothetical protein
MAQTVASVARDFNIYDCIIACPFDAFYAETYIAQKCAKLLRRFIYRDIFLQPVYRYFHFHFL